MKFDDLVDKELLHFYGVDNNNFRLGILETGELLTYEALEDPSDGYRSYLDTVEISKSSGLIFFSQPVATVVIESIDDSSFQGYRLRDLEDDHVWLCFGTDISEDYYPSFVFSYYAKVPILH